jgi:hypothetical protein
MLHGIRLCIICIKPDDRSICDVKHVCALNKIVLTERNKLFTKITELLPSVVCKLLTARHIFVTPRMAMQNVCYYKVLIRPGV